MTDTHAPATERQAELDEIMAHIIGACRCENRGCRVYLIETVAELAMRLGKPPRYGDGKTTPILPIDPAALEASVNRIEAWLAFDAVNRPGWGSIRDVSYEDYPISSADVRILAVDYRHHRPTQWAYDRACDALHAQRERAEKAEAEATRLADELDAAQSSADREAGEAYALRDENSRLKAELAALKDTRPCGRAATHPPHKWMSARRAFQCAGVGDYADSPWEREDETYEVLANDEVYEEATSLGDANFKAAKAINGIEEGELADCEIRIRRTTRESRVAQP